jgi:hypothetical protein
MQRIQLPSTSGNRKVSTLRFRGARLLLLAVASSLVLAPIELPAGDLPSSNELLALLRAKDKEFDNVRLDYEISGEVVKQPFPAWKYPGIAKTYGWENEKPRVVPFRYNESLIIRWPDVTFIREAAEGSSKSMLPYQKWSNTESKAREITRDGSKTRGNAIMTIRAGGLPVDIAQEQAMAIEFAFGFGYGSRIKQIDHIREEGTGLKVEGSIQIWWDDVSRFELLVDDRYLVRQATIESNVKGNRTRFEVTTEGTVKSGSFELAKTGSFKRIALGMEVEGKLLGKPKTVNEFRTQFKAIHENLSDDAYRKLVAMDMEPGMQVIDYVADETYFVGEETSRRRLSFRPAPQPAARRVKQSSLIPAIAITLNVLAILVLIGLVTLRYRSQKSRAEEKANL